jgi:DNA-binding NarL/FixJ family response regulator
MRMLRLVLATEHPLFRAGLRCLIEGLGRVKVVAETGSGREAVALAKTHKPGVIVIQDELGEINGLEALTQILHWSPRSRVIMISGNVDGKLESRAIEAGAAGFLSIRSTSRELEHLLQTLREAPLEDGSDGMNGGARIRRRRNGRPNRRSSPLTPRQLEVLKLLSEGSGVKRIARLLGISAKTVETHRAQVMERLHIYDLVGLVRYALREKITRL